MFKKWILLTSIIIFGLLACKPGQKDIDSDGDDKPTPSKDLKISVVNSSQEAPLNDTMTIDIDVTFKDTDLKNIKNIKETNKALYEQLVRLIEVLKFDYLVNDADKSKLGISITNPILAEDDTYTPPRITIEHVSSEAVRTNITIKTNIDAESDFSELSDSVVINTLFQNMYSLTVNNLLTSENLENDKELSITTDEPISLKVIVKHNNEEVEISEEMLSVEATDNSVISVEKDESSSELVYNIRGITEGKETSLIFTLSHPKMINSEQLRINVNVGGKVVNNYTIEIENLDGNKITEVQLNEEETRTVISKIFLNGEDVSSSFDTELLVTSSNESVATIAKKASSRRNTGREYIITGLVEGTAEITFSFNHPQTDEKVVETISVVVEKEEVIGTYSIVIKDSEGAEITDIELYESTERILTPIILLDGEDVSSSFDTELLVTSSNESVATIAKKASSRRNTEREYILAGLVEGTAEITFSFNHPQTNEEVKETISVNVQHTALYEIAILDAETNEKIDGGFTLNKGESKDILVEISADGEDIDIKTIKDLQVSTAATSITIINTENLYTITMSSSASAGYKGAINVTFTHPQTQEDISDFFTVSVPGDEGGASVDPLPEN